MMKKKKALIAVDIQNDFLPGGALAVAGGDRIVEPSLRLMNADLWDAVVMTQDWHPADHVSFSANHEGKKPFDDITLSYGAQKLWPVHCVAGSAGAEFPASLPDTEAALIIRKGMNKDVDSYSAFVEADGKTVTGLAGYLHARGVEEVYVCGLAFDFCVRFTAEDAAKAGFRTFIVDDATAAIMPETKDDIYASLARMGVGRVTVSDLIG